MTDTDTETPADRSSDAETLEAIEPWEEDGHTLTDYVVGFHHENHDGRARGCYPKGLNPSDFAGQLRRFGGKTVQYLMVIGDLNGHAVYRMLNERDGPTLHSMPWDVFIERTAIVRPDAAGLRDQQDPARTIIRTNFDTLRRRRETEIETGCTCLENEGCDHCGGQKEDPA